MLEEVVVIVWVEERLYSIWTVDCSNKNVLCRIRKNCEKQSCLPVNQSSFLRLPQKVFKKKNLMMLEEVVVIVWVEERLYSIWTVDCSNGTYFAHSAKNCEEQSIAPLNQSSLLRLPKMVFKRKIQRC